MIMAFERWNSNETPKTVWRVLKTRRIGDAYETYAAWFACESDANAEGERVARSGYELLSVTCYELKGVMVPG